MRKVVGKIVAKTKDETEVALCSRCQFELDGETTCSNCGAEIIEFDRDSLALLPADKEAPDPEASTFDQFTAEKNTINYPRAPRNIKVKKNPRKKISIKMGAIVLLGIISMVGLFFQSSLAKVALTPVIDNAVDDAQRFQSAIVRFYDRNNRWPQSMAQLSNSQYFKPSQITYFVVMPNGSFQQVFKSPFFIEGETITWQQKNNQWACESKLLKQHSLTERCTR